MRHRIEALLVQGLRVLLSIFPMSVARAVGGGLGLLVYAVDARHRHVAIENLRAAFPSRPEAERRVIARGVFAHIGRLTLEVLRLGAMSPADLDAHIETEGDDRVREAYKRGKGVLFYSGHFGYWEMWGIGYGRRMGPMSVVVRPLDNPLLEVMIARIRTMTGNTPIARQGVVRRILRELAAGRGVAMLMDQHLHGPDALDVQFFGRSAKTTSAVSAIALRTGAPVIPVFALPLPGGRYRIVAEHPIDPPPPDAPDREREFTQRCTDVLEMYVRRYPDMWLWMHRRWRDGDEPNEAGTGEVDEEGVTGGPA